MGERPLLSTGQELRRGWRTLLGSCIGLGLGLSGLPFFTFGTFVVPLNAAFGWPRGQIAATAGALVIGSAFTAPIVGSLTDRFSVKRIGAISMVCMALCYLVIARSGADLALFRVLWLALALLGAGTQPVVWTRAINIWFDRARGLALGITLAGAGLASVLGPLFCTALIQSYSWRAGYIGISALLLVIAVPSILLFFQDRPPQANLADRQELSGLTLRETVHTVQFWKIAVGFFVIAAPLAASLVNMVPILIDRGLAPMHAAQLAGLLGVTIVIGRVSLGYFVDHFPPLAVAAIMLSGSVIGCLLLGAGIGDAGVAAIGVGLIGLAVGAEIDLVAYFCSRYFGMRAYGKIYGWQTTTFYVASAMGQVLTGLAYDRFQSYRPSLFFTAASISVGICVIASLGKMPARAEQIS